MDDLHFNVSMHCSVCGSDMFSLVDESADTENLGDAPDETKIRCSDCGKITTKAQLMEDNRGTIDANLQDLKNEATKQIEKELNKLQKELRKLFK